MKELTMKEIALRSGFSNQPQFQRKFKELTGLTPKVFQVINPVVAKGPAEGNKERPGH
jgi:AraC-like DNA-binding protein